ncbi:MAG: vitamin B12-dependent ribonucleotide reductase, partial [Patescibacteria group bacterium]
LQYGVPLKELASKFIHMRFEPMGITNNKEIPIVSSIVDYIFKYLALRFLSPEELKALGLEPSDYKFLKDHPQLFENLQSNFKYQAKSENEKELLGPPCKNCGGITVRTGNCYTCRECGESTGGCG